MHRNYLFNALLIVLFALANWSSIPTGAGIPVTGPFGKEPANTLALPTLQEFSTFLSGNGEPAGIYSPSFAFPIVQQPDENPGFVSSDPDLVTQFSMASRYGTTGILAHNTLAGAKFSQIQVGQFLTLVYSDGRLEYFEVTTIESYQALSPESTTSNFISLEKPGKNLSSTQLFNHVYAAGKKLVLQTCIASNGIDSWGRLFVIATPVVTTTLASIQREEKEIWVVGHRFKVI